MNKGTLYFFTGLAGAGKTTIGGEFFRRMKARRNDVVLFDGDQTRPVYDANLGYSTEERFRLAQLEFRIIRMLTGQGINAVCCAIAIIDGVISRMGLAALLGFALHMDCFGFWMGDALAGFMPLITGGTFYLSGRWKEAPPGRR